MDILDSILNESVVASTKINVWLSTIDFEEIDSELVKEHLFILNETKQQIKYQLSDKEEMIIAMMKQTGSTSFARLKDELIA